MRELLPLLMMMDKSMNFPDLMKNLILDRYAALTAIPDLK